MTDARPTPPSALWRLAGLSLAILAILVGVLAWWAGSASERLEQAQRQADMEVLLKGTAQAVRESMEASAYGTLEARLVQSLSHVRLRSATVIDPSGKVLASVRRDPASGQVRPSFAQAVLNPPTTSAGAAPALDAPVLWQPLGEQGSLGWLKLERDNQADGAWQRLGHKLLLAAVVGTTLVWLVFVLLLRRATMVHAGSESAPRRPSDAAMHQDSLTGLPDRDALLARLKESMGAADEAGQGSLAICYIDIDRFALINAECSPRVGDKVLQAVGSRIRSIARQGDMLARVGGDEFALLVHGLNNIWEVEPVLSRLLHVSTAPFLAEGHSARLSFSIGVVLYPQDQSEPMAFLAHAEQAMHQAKRTGGKGWAMWQAPGDDEA